MMSVDRPVERDADLEITMVDDSISSKQKRLNLLDFLIQSPPPEPLHWTSFRDYIVNRFGLVYPEKIIKDVFQHIDRAITKKRYVSAVIDLDSDEEHANSNNQGRGNRDSSCFSVPQPITFTESINGAFSRSVEDADDSCTFNILDDSPINREEFEEFRRNPVVKQYSKLLKDIYNLLKEIKESTSCRVCSKLRYRYLKYTEVVSKDSELLRKTRSDQETADVNSSSRVQRPRRKSSTEKSYFQLMKSKFLTEKEADKIREAILMDKLIELSYPDVLTSAESIQPTQSDITNHEAGTPQRRKPKKSKKKSRSEPVPPDSSGAKEAEKKGSTNTESAISPKRKRGRPKKKSLHSIADDEQPESIVQETDVIEPTLAGDDTQIRRKKSLPQTEHIEGRGDPIEFEPSGDDPPIRIKEIHSQASHT